MNSRSSEVQDVESEQMDAPALVGDAVERAFQVYQTALAAHRALKPVKAQPLRPYPGRDLLR